jgi:hypothetical protein
MATGKNNPRQARLAAALKENLKRRKAQERAGTASKALAAAPQTAMDGPPAARPKSAPKPD